MVVWGSRQFSNFQTLFFKTQQLPGDSSNVTKLYPNDRWVGHDKPSPFERSRKFSPSQKGHQQNCQASFFFFGCLFFFSLVLPRIVVSFWFGGGSEPLKSHNRKPTGRNFLRSRVFLPRRGGTCLPGSSSVDLPSSGLQVDPI